MAVYTNDLRLKEIATGDEAGTWGTSTNTNLSLVAEAFSFGTEAITTNADTHTTTIADGSTDPGRSIFLKYTGTLDSACTITLGPNSVSKLWFIENGTSGSQSIIISQGSGANVTIPNGQTKAVYSDGAGSGAAVVDAFQDLSIPDLFIDDDLTFTSDSAVITFGADGDTTLTHTDGTGLTLNGTNKLTFGDVASFVQQSSDGVLRIDGEATIDLNASTAVTVSNDLKLDSDSAVLGFGADNDTTLTHTDGSGLTLNSTNKIMFNDASQFIQGSSATVLSLGATDEIDLTATLIDINGNADVSGTVTATGTSVFASLDISGDIDVDGTTNLDVVDIDGAVDMASTLQVDGAITSSSGATITTTGNTAQLQLISTDADAGSGPQLDLYRNSSSPADNDEIGRIYFYGENDADEKIEYVLFRGTIVDASDASEESALQIYTYCDGGQKNRIDLIPDETVFNEGSHDIDHRIESNNNANMFFVDAGNDRIQIANLLLGEISSNVDIIQSTSSSGLLIDVTGELTLDADLQGTGNGIILKDAGTAYGSFFRSSSNFHIKSEASDQDMIFMGNDGGSEITALTLDMSNAGDATFNAGVGVGGASPGSSALVVRADTDKNMTFSSAIGETGDVITIQGTNDDGTSMVGIGLAGSSIVLERGPVTINDNSADLDFRVESNNKSSMLFVDGGNDCVVVGGSTVETADQFEVLGNDSNTFIRFRNTNAGAGGPVLIFDKASASPADDDVCGDIRFIGLDSGANATQYAGIVVRSGDVTNGTEDGVIEIDMARAGNYHNMMQIKSDATTFNQDSHDIDFRVESDANANMIFVDAANNFVGIGTADRTAVSSTAQAMHIAGGSSDSVTPVLLVTDADGSVEGNSTIIESSFSGDSSFTAGLYFKCTDSNGTQGSISGTGDGTISFNTSSDERLKQGIQDTDSKWDLVKSLQVRDYEWKKSGKQETGFIAQELHDKWAQPVKVGGEDVEADPWTVDYGKLTPILTKALQEAMEKIETLEAEVAKLKGE